MNRDPGMDWRTFQRFVDAIQADLMPGFVRESIEFEDDNRGLRRQLDAVYVNTEGTYPIRLLVEATKSGDKVGLRQMDSFLKKAERLECDKMVVVSKTGFTKGALQSAKDGGAETWILRAVTDEDLEGTIGKVAGTLRVSVPRIEQTNLRFKENIPSAFPTQLREHDRDSVHIYAADGEVKGNIWDFLQSKSNEPGHHTFELADGDHVYIGGEQVELAEVSTTVVDDSIESPWEVDLDKDLLAVYENAQDPKDKRFLYRHPGLPDEFMALRREDFE